MHIEFLVEEPSAEAALYNLVPKIVGPNISFLVHPHQGKDDLVGKLRGRLAGYRRWLPLDWRIVILIDTDEDDCEELKEKLEQACHEVGLSTKSTSSATSFQVVNRIAVEELEAWFFGDVDALVTAFPRVSPTLAEKRGFRDSDAIIGGTWEALERVLQNAGYFRGGLPKIEAARVISSHMDPSKNRSRSFQMFRDALLTIVS